jgi:argininosuccinate lyase
MVPLNRSLTVDFRLWPHDIEASKVWAQGLVRAAVIGPDEGATLLDGLEKVAQVLSQGDHSDAPDEDVHSLVERLLMEEVGPVAGKLHTGRSRNDQVATDFRLWGMEASERLSAGVQDLLRSFLTLAESGMEVILPGHTHLQQAQPIRASHWALSHFWPLLRDRERFRQIGISASSLPLGSGALAGCPFPVDRDWLRDALGFKRVAENSLDAVSDRDWAAEMVFAGALSGAHMSRLGEDLVLFSSREFGYLELPEGYCTGSSLMPQKRNPDAAELVRGKMGRLLGNLTGLLTVLKGLPTGYNRDLQEDKGFLFDTVDTLLQALPVMQSVVAEAQFRGDTIRDRLDPELLATDIADYLVKKGVPFRESHEVVGRLVRTAEDRGTSIADLPFSAFREAHSTFGEDVSEVFSFEASVEARGVSGGTSRQAVENQMALARKSIES